MIRTDFSNYRQVYGGGNQLVTELLKLAAHVEANPTSAADTLALFDADVAKIKALVAAPVEPVDPPELAE